MRRGMPGARARPVFALPLLLLLLPLATQASWTLELPADRPAGTGAESTGPLPGIFPPFVRLPDQPLCQPHREAIVIINTSPREPLVLYSLTSQVRKKKRRRRRIKKKKREEEEEREEEKEEEEEKGREKEEQKKRQKCK